MKQLAVADEIVFLGYSFSESDIEMRYLFTRALHMRNGKPWKKVTVVNTGQSIVFERYERFFGAVQRVDKKASDFLRHLPRFIPERKIAVFKDRTKGRSSVHHKSKISKRGERSRLDQSR